MYGYERGRKRGSREMRMLEHPPWKTSTPKDWCKSLAILWPRGKSYIHHMGLHEGRRETSEYADPEYSASFEGDRNEGTLSICRLLLTKGQTRDVVYQYQ